MHFLPIHMTFFDFIVYRSLGKIQREKIFVRCQVRQKLNT